MAVVNGSLCGWEIKSERDTLSRLSSQADAYCRVFDQVTLVASERHLPKVTDAVPSWWGLSLVCENTTGDGRLEPLRAPKDNPGTDPEALVELLWRDEAMALLIDRGLGAGL